MKCVKARDEVDAEHETSECEMWCKKGRIKKTRVFKMADKEELLAEAVRRFPVLCDRSHHTFKDQNKKNMA